MNLNVILINKWFNLFCNIVIDIWVNNSSFACLFLELKKKAKFCKYFIVFLMSKFENVSMLVFGKNELCNSKYFVWFSEQNNEWY